MKKLLFLTAIFCVIMITSCKKDHKHGPDTHEHTEEAEDVKDEKAIAMSDAYQCPMDCEKGKTYDTKGTCPTCKMDLKKLEEKKEESDSEHKHGDHDGHEH